MVSNKFELVSFLNNIAMSEWIFTAKMSAVTLTHSIEILCENILLAHNKLHLNSISFINETKKILFSYDNDNLINHLY